MSSFPPPIFVLCLLGCTQLGAGGSGRHAAPLTDRDTAMAHVVAQLEALPGNLWWRVTHPKYEPSSFILQGLKSASSDPAAVSDWNIAWPACKMLVYKLGRLGGEPEAGRISLQTYGGGNGNAKWICTGKPKFKHPQVQMEGEYHEMDSLQQGAVRAQEYSPSYVDASTRSQKEEAHRRLIRFTKGTSAVGGGPDRDTSAENNWGTRREPTKRTRSEAKMNARKKAKVTPLLDPKTGKPFLGVENIARLKFENNWSNSQTKTALASVKRKLPREHRGDVSNVQSMSLYLDGRACPALNTEGDFSAARLKDFFGISLSSPPLQRFLKPSLEIYGLDQVCLVTFDGFNVANGVTSTAGTLQWQNLTSIRTSPAAAAGIYLDLKGESKDRMFSAVQYVFAGAGKTVTWTCADRGVCFLDGSAKADRACGPGVQHTAPLRVVAVCDGKAACLFYGMKKSVSPYSGAHLKGELAASATSAADDDVAAVAGHGDTFDDASAYPLQVLKKTVKQMRTAAGIPLPNKTAAWRRADVVKELRERLAAEAKDTAATAAPPPVEPSTPDGTVDMATKVFLPANSAYDAAVEAFLKLDKGNVLADFESSELFAQWQREHPTQIGRAGAPSIEARWCFLHCVLNVVKTVCKITFTATVMLLCADGYPGIEMYCDFLCTLGMPWVARNFRVAMEASAPALVEISVAGSKKTGTATAAADAKIAANYSQGVVAAKLRVEEKDLAASGLITAASKGMLVKQLKQKVNAGLVTGMQKGKIDRHVLVLATALDTSRFDKAVVEQARLRAIDADGAAFQIEAIDPVAVKEALSNTLDAMMGKDCMKLVRGAWKGAIQCFNTNNLAGSGMLRDMATAIQANTAKFDALVEQRTALQASMGGTAMRESEQDGGDALADIVERIADVEDAAAKLAQDLSALQKTKPLDTNCKTMYTVWELFTDFFGPLCSGQQEQQLVDGAHKEAVHVFVTHIRKTKGIELLDKLYWHTMYNNVQAWIDECRGQYNGAMTVATFTSQCPEHVGKIIKERLRYLLGIAKMNKVDPTAMILKHRLLRLIHFPDTISKRSSQTCSACKQIGHNRNNFMCTGPKKAD